ncbi:hypothetical protein [Citricoccus muralis]|uniref:ATP-grasp domain-containing protein n=1 Tax=Citricoccus muralis TaxID=169134 RepID=A0ABY8H718_9MICC|nr:hypothetical protein [Citricoccus muralis]WFP16721.1 hypothetical protein P8192_00915 [Citricoccus muralis]
MTSSVPQHFSVDVVREAFGTPLAGYSIVLEAWRRGLEVRLLDGQMRRFFISSENRRIKFDKARPSTTTATAMRVVKSKSMTSARLRGAGVPVPANAVIDPANEDAVERLVMEASALGYPVVLKPLIGSMGRDVYTNIQTEADLLEIYRYLNRAGQKKQKYILEEHFAGEDYRVLVIGDRVTGAVLRRPANVIGDGEHTIAELISLKNKARSCNPHLSSKRIKPDHELRQFISRQGLNIESVPDSGTLVMLRGKANATQGGDSIDRTDEVPEALKAAAVRAVAAIPGLFMAGVDIIYDEKR